MPVTLINVFSVPAATETEFVQVVAGRQSAHHNASRIHQRHVSQESQAGQPVQLYQRGDLGKTRPCIGRPTRRASRP